MCCNFFYNNNIQINFLVCICVVALENRDICGVMLESNVGVYLIYMQCEFILSSLIASLAHLML